MLSNLGATELLVIGLFVLIFFGGKRLNEMARTLGEASREMKSIKNEYEEALSDDPLKEDLKKKAASTENTQKSA